MAKKTNSAKPEAENTKPRNTEEAEVRIADTTGMSLGEYYKHMDILMAKAEVLVKDRIKGSRKGMPDEPAYLHSFRVRDAVSDTHHWDDPDYHLFIAALLHDVVEDGGVTFDELIELELIILEIKKANSLGLTHYSQLVGYCLVSSAKFGLLINVDGLPSPRFKKFLLSDPDLTHIERAQRGNKLTHVFGVMKWDSVTKRVEYTSAGSIKSLPDLSQLLTDELS